ncbi:MAG: TIM barrel protein [Oscillospiraceae bacterium]|jgi:sugar phosphate isomerase/epimerase|nr:TIM barrel protein [Oscillospiraceae bacterium]
MKVGLQLYSVKENMEKDARKTMKTVADLGYKYIETYCYKKKDSNADESDEINFGLGMDRREAKAFLDASGIKVVGGHYYYPGNPVFEKMCDYYASLGGIQFGSGGDFFSGGMDELKRKMELMVKDAEIAKSYGLRYYYHNHFWEFQKFGDEYVWDIMVKELPKDLVWFELDNYWAARGGMNPVDVIKKTGDRLILLHQKDFSKTAGVPLNLFESVIDPTGPLTQKMHGDNRHVTDFAEVGNGILPIQDYITAGNEVGVEYILLEQDLTAIDELDSIRISMDAFKKFSGVEWA